MSATAFVTGGTGFVGGAVLRRLVEEGFRVRGLARDRTGGEQIAAAGAEPVIGHLFEPEVLAQGMAGCEYVFHVAGINRMCVRDPSEMLRVNVDGTRVVVEAAAAAGTRRVVYTSSAASIGESYGTIGREDSPHRGSFLSAYERSKHEGERAALAVGEEKGVEVVSVNPSSVQGPGRTRGSARLLLRVLNARVAVAIDTTVSIVDIADAAEGHRLAALHGVSGERYLLNGTSIGIRRAIEMLAELTGRRIRSVVVPAAVVRAMAPVAGSIAGRGDDSFVCRDSIRTLLHGHRYDGSKAVRDLGLAYTPIEETLERTIAWYVEYGFVRRPLPRFPHR